MSVSVRLITEDEFEAWDTLITNVFGEDPRPEDMESFRNRIEFDRARAAFDGDEMVGTAGEHSYRMTLPGGTRVPAGAVTVVVVKSTHRRRGVLREMMRDQLAAVKEREEPLAALWSSESAIYGRFGYGPAMEGGEYTIERQHTALAVPEATEGRVRQIDVEEAKLVIPPLYEKATAEIPGTMTRRDCDWTGYFRDPEHWRDGASANRFVIFEDGKGEPRGYVRYRQKPKWDEAHAVHELRVGEMHTLDATAYAALYRYLFSIDLVTKVKLINRRLHEPLLQMLADPRRLRGVRAERIWLRMLDVPALLSARSYPVEGELVLEVVDDFMDLAGGRFLLQAGPDGAECVRTDREPDLTLSIADLGSAYLGVPRLWEQHWVGRVDGDQEAVRRAQSMFSWHIEPWCTVFF